MARQRKAGRKLKPGPRTKCGRLSRAYKDPEIRDQGTREFCAKRAYLVNGADPALAATASGILLANGLLTREQHDAALRYSWAHALTYGKVWRQTCPLGEDAGRAAPDRLLELARDKLAWMDGRLDLAQRKAVADVAVFGFLPMWWMASKLKLRSMPEDERDRAALLSGLDVISGARAERTEPSADGSE
jgi:hypothetical protein